MKPDAPSGYVGEFKPIATTAPGIQLCEHLPHVARQAHHLAIVRSLGHYGRARNDHITGYYYNLTGHVPDGEFPNSRRPKPTDWPYIGCVVGAKRPDHPYLPNAVTLPGTAGEPDGLIAGQYAARLGVQHDPLYLFGDLKNPLNFQVPSLALKGDVSLDRLHDRRWLLGQLNAADRALEQAGRVDDFSLHQQKALSLLASPRTKDAFDVSREPQAVRDRYGPGVNAMSMLMARRLVEAEVPFVTIFWKRDPEEDERTGCKGGGWDTHWKNFPCLKNVLLPKFDRPFAALLADLDQRGLLEETLVIVTSEMGRTPKVGDVRSADGRDHWTHCMSVLLAGGGVRGGQVYGSSDRLGAYPDNNPVEPEDMARTIYYAMGIDDLTATAAGGRKYNLLEGGKPITALF